MQKQPHGKKYLELQRKWQNMWDHMRQGNKNNVPADTPHQYWKWALFYPLLDHVCQEIDDRLLQSAPQYSAQFLVPS